MHAVAGFWVGLPSWLFDEVCVISAVLRLPSFLPFSNGVELKGAFRCCKAFVATVLQYPSRSD